MDDKKTTLTQVLYIILILILGYIITYQRDQINTYKIESSMLEGGDIYKSELLDSISKLNIDLGRYEAALNMLKDQDSVAASKYENVLYTLE